MTFILGFVISLIVGYFAWGFIADFDVEGIIIFPLFGAIAFAVFLAILTISDLDSDDNNTDPPPVTVVHEPIFSPDPTPLQDWVTEEYEYDSRVVRLGE